MWDAMSPLTPPAMSDAEKKSDAASADSKQADKKISNRTKLWLRGDSEYSEDDGGQADGVPSEAASVCPDIDNIIAEEWTRDSSGGWHSVEKKAGNTDRAALDSLKKVYSALADQADPEAPVV